jgi:hypothetical protein
MTRHVVPSPEARARALAAIAGVAAPTRAEHRRRESAVAMAAATATAALFFAMGGFGVGARPGALVAFTSGLGLVAAFAVTFGGLSRVESRSERSERRVLSMLGRPAEHLLLLCFALAPALTVVALGAAALWPGDVHEDVSPHAHLACLAVSLIQGALPLAALLLIRRGSDPIHPGLTGAVLGTIAGGWTSAMAYLRCPHASVAHGLVAPVAPVILLAALGCVLGRALLKIR